MRIDSSCSQIMPFMAAVFVYENINLPTLKNITPFPCIEDAPIQ